MGQIVVVGLDIAKPVFQVHGIATARWWFGGVCGGRGWCRSSRRSSPVGSASRRVAAGTIGHENCARSGTMSG